MRFPQDVLARFVLGVTLVLFANAIAVAETPDRKPPPGMVWIAGGEFTMGSAWELARHDEKPVHRVRVDGFWMAATEVTNAQFRQFVEATGYVTTANIRLGRLSPRRHTWSRGRRVCSGGVSHA